MNETNAMKGNQCIYVALKHDVFVETASRIQFAASLSNLARPRHPYDAAGPLSIASMSGHEWPERLWGP